MKNNIFRVLKILVIPMLWFSQISAAQVPQKLSYQAVVRNHAGELVTEQAVSVQVSILQSTAEGDAVFIETHTPLTNVNGLLSIEIGGGSIVSGLFNAIDWSDGKYFLKTEIDPTGGINYTINSVSQLLSVPYALYAEQAGSVSPGPAGGDLTGFYPDPQISTGAVTGDKINSMGAFPGQVLGWDGSNWSPALLPEGSKWSSSENNIVFNSGNVGIGRSNPQQKLDVLGKLRLLDDAIEPTEGTIRYNFFTQDFEGHGVSGYKSFTKPNIALNYGAGASVDFTTRNDWVYINPGVTVPESGMYMIWYEFRIQNLTFGFLSGTSDREVQFNLVSEGETGNLISVLDTKVIDPNLDANGGATLIRFKNPETLSGFQFANLGLGQVLKMRIRVNTINGDPTGVITAFGPRMYIMKID